MRAVRSHSPLSDLSSAFPHAVRLVERHMRRSVWRHDRRFDAQTNAVASSFGSDNNAPTLVEAESDRGKADRFFVIR